jgi:hypothetical protein
MEGGRTFQVPPKRRFLQEPRGVTSQITPFFIVTAVKNLKSYRNGYSVCEKFKYTNTELKAIMNVPPLRKYF